MTKPSTERVRAWREKNPEQYRKHWRVAQRSGTRFLQTVKLSSGCMACRGGTTNPEHLEFHHVGKKRFNLARRASCSRANLIREMAQCIVLCKECHERIHNQEEAA